MELRFLVSLSLQVLQQCIIINERFLHATERSPTALDMWLDFATVPLMFVEFYLLKKAHLEQKDPLQRMLMLPPVVMPCSSYNW